jgi:hypothetical protein
VIAGSKAVEWEGGIKAERKGGRREEGLKSGREGGTWSDGGR